MSKLNPRHFALLSHLQIGGCTCNTKTPELRFHSEDCRYRLAAEIERTLLDASAPTLGENADSNPPFSNCSFRICDLPGQCRAEGKCHHPKDEQPGLTDEQPSFTNPLTPYGMLVRALRIVAGTTLYDMAKALLTTPAKLSSMEFGRAPVTQEFAFDVSAYFDALGVPNTQASLEAALRASTLLAQKEPRS